MDENKRIFTFKTLKEAVMDNVVYKIRHHLGLTPTRFAQIIGTGRTMIPRYENHTRKPSIEVAAKILVLAEKVGYKISIKDIYYDEFKKAYKTIKSKP